MVNYHRVMKSEPQIYLQLTEEERQELEALVQRGKTQGYRIKHAQILLKLDEIPENQEWTYDKIKEAYHAAPHTISQIAKRFVTGGLEAALGRKEQANRHKKIDGRVEAHIIAIACSEAPEGRERWTLHLTGAAWRCGQHFRHSGHGNTEKNELKPYQKRSGASQNQGRSLQRGWRTFWMYISVLMILCARWSAWMRRTGSLLRSGGFRRNLEVQGERIMNTAAAVW